MNRRSVMAGAALGVFGVTRPASAQPDAQHSGNRVPNMVAPGLRLPKSFLHLPFREGDAWKSGGHCNISEGWYYGMERGIHGAEGHHALDFNLPYGADVLAPANGWAAYTYHSYYTPTEYQGKRVGLGLGLWLLTMHQVPDGGNVSDRPIYWWTKSAHLSWVDPSLRYLKPTVDADGDWHEPNSGPDNLYVPDPQLAQHFTPIRRGQVLARVGDTGVEWGYRDQFDPETGVVTPRNRHELPAWDLDIHLHFQVYRRENGSPGEGEEFSAKLIPVDPFGQYGQVRRWQGVSPYDGYQTGPGQLWVTNQFGKPLYAA